MQIESLPLFHSYSDDPLLQEKHSDTRAGVTYTYRMEKETFVATETGETTIPEKNSTGLTGRSCILYTGQKDQRR
jgi:hypothetical protein